MGETTQLPGYIYIWVAVVALVFMGSIIVIIVRNKKSKTSVANFLQQHPDAAKVFFGNSKKAMTNEIVTVYSVNGAAPILFAEGMQGGFYLEPGSHEVQIEYVHSRAGILYRNVSNSTGAVKKVLTVEPGCAYRLGFDRKESRFTFEDLTKQA